jgi:CheY-like chemotaxis protein
VGLVKILCVDDDPEFLRILGRMLEEKGYEVYLAESGKKALEILKNVSPDLILLDIMMPELDGWETLKEIRSTGNKAPVIMITIMYAIEDREKSFEHGADAHVPKPIKKVQLFKTIEWVLKNSARRRSLANH